MASSSTLRCVWAGELPVIRLPESLGGPRQTPSSTLPQADDGFAHSGIPSSDPTRQLEFEREIAGFLEPHSIFHVRVRPGRQLAGTTGSGCLQLLLAPRVDRLALQTRPSLALLHIAHGLAPVRAWNACDSRSASAPRLQLLRTVRQAAATRVGQDLDLLALQLAGQGYRVSIRRGQGGGSGTQCFKNLRHSFLAVQSPNEGDEPYLVEVRRRGGGVTGAGFFVS